MGKYKFEGATCKGETWKHKKEKKRRWSIQPQKENWKHKKEKTMVRGDSCCVEMLGKGDISGILNLILFNGSASLKSTNVNH